MKMSNKLIKLIGEISTQKKKYNSGVCPYCNRDLKLLAINSRGGKSYGCIDCDYTAFVSHDVVDRKRKRR